MGENRDIQWDDIDYYGMLLSVVKNIWVVILLVISAVLCTELYYSTTYVPQYTTESTFAVSAKVGSDDVYSNLSTTMNMATTFQEVFQSDLMKEAIAEELNWDRVDGSIYVDVIDETNLMVVRVVSSTPEKSYRTMKALIKKYPEISDSVFGNTVLQMLVQPEVPYGPSNHQDITSILKKVRLASLALGIFLIMLLYYFRDTIMTESSAKKQLDSKLLGVINYETKNKTITTKLKRVNKSVLISNPVASFFFTESMQKIATKIAFELKKQECKTVMVTSVMENEGKTTVAANLALSLAMTGYSVVLMEGDYHKPAVYKIMNIKKDTIVDYVPVLEKMVPCEEFKEYDQYKNLQLLLCNESHTNAEPIIQSQNMKKLLEECRETFDYVIIDTPPVGFMVDTEEFANLVDASILVVRQNKVKVQQINDTIDALEQRHAKLLGYVLNGVNRVNFSLAHSYGYKYGYGYRYGGYGKYGAYKKNHQSMKKETE